MKKQHLLITMYSILQFLYVKIRSLRILQNVFLLITKRYFYFNFNLKFIKNTKDRSKYIQKIIENINSLFFDPFGKYVVKRVLNLVDIDFYLLEKFKYILNTYLKNNQKL